MRLSRLLALISAVIVGLAGSLVAAAPASAATAPKPKGEQCRGARDDEWPDWVNGKPAGFDAGDNGGVYVWHDGAGWHLRVTHKTDDQKVFAGEVRTRGELVDVQGVALEKGDRLEVTHDRHELRFRFRNYGHIDGLDFRTVCAPALAMRFAADGHRLPADRVVIGHEDRHPDHDPFRIQRQA